MNTIVLLAAFVGTVDYSAGRSECDVPVDYGAGRQVIEQPIVAKEEEDEADKPGPEHRRDPLLVVVYVDLADVAGLRKLLTQCDRLPGLRVEYRDKSFVPDEGKRFRLPLAQFCGNGSWWFIEWRDAEAFRGIWARSNTAADGRIPDAAIRIPSGIAESNRYPAWSHEWHITQGESIESLRSHLSVPRREHHGASFARGWLDTLSFVDLIGLHSDAHNNRVRWEFVGNRAAPATAGGRLASGAASEVPRQTGVWELIRPGRSSRRSDRNCPNGKCPR